MTKKIAQKDGEAGEIILFVVFVVLFLVMFVSLFLSNTLARQAKTSNNVLNSIQAYYVADSQSESLLNWLATTSDDVAGPKLFIGSDLTDDISSNTFDAPYDYTVTVSVASPLRIDIIGTENRTSRAIQLFW